MSISLLVNEYNKHFNKYIEGMASLNYGIISYNTDDVSSINQQFIDSVDPSHKKRAEGRSLSKNITNINAQISDTNQQYKVANNLNHIYNLFIIAIIAILLFTFISSSK